MILLHTEMRQTGLSNHLIFMGLPCFPFFKIALIFLLFQSVGISLQCQDSSNVMHGDIAISSTSSLRTHW